jgi:nitrogen-specific signal transduction histidine kinase
VEQQMFNTEKLASLGLLAAGVAHEINNPLGVILGYCDYLLEKIPPEEKTHQLLEKIERQGNHCKRIVGTCHFFPLYGSGRRHRRHQQQPGECLPSFKAT